jgi:hypothetical protein
MSQVRGHLAMCPGTAIRRGAIPQGRLGQLAVATQLNSVGGVFDTNLTGQVNQHQHQQLQPVVSQLQPVVSQPVGPGQLNYSVYEDLQQRVAQLENEYNHMLVERNSPGGFFGLGGNSLLWVVVVGLLFLFLMEQRDSQCSNAPSIGKPSRRVSNIGERVMTKLTDRFATKAADSLFG